MAARSYWVSIGFGVAWFVVASLAFARVTKRRRDLKLPVRATFVVTALAVSFLFYWTSIRSTTVHERVATGTPASHVQPAAGRRRGTSRSSAARSSRSPTTAAARPRSCGSSAGGAC